MKCGYVDRNGKRCHGTPKLGELTQVRIFIITVILNPLSSCLIFFLFLNYYLKVTGLIISKKKFIGCANWKHGEKDHRYLTVPNTVDMELLEILFDKHTYHARGIDFEVNLFLYF